MTRKSAKPAKPATTRTVAAKPRAPKSVGGYKVIGTTRDGVHILESPARPTSFTIPELQKAIADVLARERKR